MRCARTARETAAWQWFMGTFIDCVVGKPKCHQSKYLVPVSASTITISDEAFALLLFENYEEKWQKQCQHDKTKTVLSAKMPRTHGKFTSKTMGQSEFGGWSIVGLNKFNAYCKRIQQQRASAAGKKAEQELLTYLAETPQGEEMRCRHMRQEKRRRTMDTNPAELTEDAWNELE